MKSFQWMKASIVALAAVGMVMPNANVMAAPQAAQASAVVDVALAHGGQLNGRVVDAQGASLTGASVVIKQGQQEVARTVSDKSGQFSAQGLKGGVYTIAAGQSQGTYRLWSERTAPPAAKEGVVLVSGNGPVRGQLSESPVVTTVLVAGVIASAVLAGLAYDEAKDNGDKIDRLPTSP